MGVSKNRGTPKWMVKIMENPIEMDDLGIPLFLETPIYHIISYTRKMQVSLCYRPGCFYPISVRNFAPSQFSIV